MYQYIIGTLLTLLVGCDEASDLKRDANEAQHRADEQIMDAKVEASQSIRDAQADANETIAEAKADFTTLREQYRRETSMKLSALDQEIAGMEAEALKANGAVKSGLEYKLKRIRASRAAFVKDYEALGDVTWSTWDEAKVRLDREWIDLRQLVNER